MVKHKHQLLKCNWNEKLWRKRFVGNHMSEYGIFKRMLFECGNLTFFSLCLFIEIKVLQSSLELNFRHLLYEPHTQAHQLLKHRFFSNNICAKCGPWVRENQWLCLYEMTSLSSLINLRCEWVSFTVTFSPPPNRCVKRTAMATYGHFLHSCQCNTSLMW